MDPQALRSAGRAWRSSHSGCITVMGARRLSRDPTPASRAIAPGARYPIRGRVTTTGSGPSGRPQLVLETSHGRVTVCVADRLLFTDGVLENLSGKPVEVGDEIELTARGARLADGAIGLYHELSTGCLLLEPSPDRRSGDQALRALVSTQLGIIDRGLELGDYAGARSFIGIARQLELTRDERHRISVAIERMPVSERPAWEEPRLAAGELREWARFATEEVVKTYGVAVQGMSQEEFKTFCRAALFGAHEKLRDDFGAAAVSLFGLMPLLKLSAQEQLELIDAAIVTRRELIDQPFDFDLHQSDQTIVRAALRQLCSMNDARGPRYVLDFFSWQLARLRARQPMVSDPVDWTFDCVNALERSLREDRFPSELLPDLIDVLGEAYTAFAPGGALEDPSRIGLSEDVIGPVIQMLTRKILGALTLHAGGSSRDPVVTHRWAEATGDLYGDLSLLRRVVSGQRELSWGQAEFILTGLKRARAALDPNECLARAAIDEAIVEVVLHLV